MDTLQVLTYVVEGAGAIGILFGFYLLVMAAGRSVPRAAPEPVCGPAPVKHHHYYRPDISDWWCAESGTVTDWCQELNPH